MSSLHQSYSMSDLSLATEAAEEQAVAPKRTMSMHRNRRERDQPHQTKRRGGAASTRGAVSSNSNMSSSRSVSSPRAASGEAQAASKTCALYGTLPRSISFIYTRTPIHNYSGLFRSTRRRVTDSYNSPRKAADSFYSPRRSTESSHTSGSRERDREWERKRGSRLSLL